MSFIEYSITSWDDTAGELAGMMKRLYGKNDPGAEDQIKRLLNSFNRHLVFFIEYPYVDRIYRDSYYTYFSSKHNDYFRDCLRVSLFDQNIREKDFRSTTGAAALQNAFRGFFIIRPTFPSVIGRTLIDPRAFVNNAFSICRYTTGVLVNGIKLQVTGFPFSSQDAESISCAETTIWAIMEYFGNRYAGYQPVNPSTIIAVLNRHSKKRLIPSAGLTVDQISIALKEFGFATQIYAREDAYGQEIENIISIYVESGIPIIAAIENDLVGHAILLIGHENDDRIDVRNAPRREIEYAGVSTKYIDYGDLPKRFIVNDDNLTPYTSITLKQPAEHYLGVDEGFLGSAITSIVVPLHKKIYLEALDAKQLTLQIISDPHFGFKFKEDFIFRFFLASSRSFKYHVALLPGLSKKLKDKIIGCRMPKFIWCGEFYSQADFAENTAKALVIIDATEADDVWIDSLLFAGYSNRCYVKFEKGLVSLPDKLVGYSKFISNLH